MNKRAITSIDVAKRAGVSQSAVSRVFTPGGSASARTTEKVRKAAAELGYVPNPIARAMITGKSRIIGLVVAYLDNQFYPMALQDLSKALQDQGYHILIFMAGNDVGRVAQVVDEMLSYRVEGIITASVAISNELGQRCEAQGIPVVMFNRAQDDDRLSAVTSDNVEGARLATEHLIATGHQRISHIAGWQGSSTGRDRALGFAQAMQAAGQAPSHWVDGMYDQSVVKAQTRQIFAQPERPDAIFVGNDHMAFAVMDVLRHDLRLRVPQDVSVIGFDDVPIAAWPAYDLTTVRQPVDDMVAATVTLLMSRLQDSDPPAHVTLPTQLIIRGSTRPAQGPTP